MFYAHLTEFHTILSSNVPNGCILPTSSHRQAIDMIPVETSTLIRHQEIQGLIQHGADNVVDAAIHHWEHMATHIITIIGEGGFNALYKRSAYITRTTFPQLADNLPSGPADGRFASLRTSHVRTGPRRQCPAVNHILRYPGLADRRGTDYPYFTFGLG